MLSHRALASPRIGAGVLRIGGDRLPEGLLGLLAVQVVELARRLGPQRHRFGVGGARSPELRRPAGSDEACELFSVGARLDLTPLRACTSLYLLHTIARWLAAGDLDGCAWTS